MSITVWGRYGHLVFPVGLKNTTFSFRREIADVSANQMTSGLSFFNRPEKTKKKLVEDMQSLILVMFRWIPFSAINGEIENVSAYQRPGMPSYSSDRPKINKPCRGHDFFYYCFLSSYVEFYLAVSDKKSNIGNVNEGRTTENMWSE